MDKIQKEIKDGSEVAVLGGGCFWCLEAIFLNIKGVFKVTPGYSGGERFNPTYKEVQSGKTGYAEVVKIKYDSKIIKYEDILNVFFGVHDPTTINRQGNDIGPQYRSVIFYINNEQRKIAEKVIKKLSKAHIYNNPVLTELNYLKKFYQAEQYHQRYFEKNPEKAYCQLVIAPKLAEFRENYSRFYK
jgi:peptide-methionine (S)-S-oxide reductase